MMKYSFLAPVRSLFLIVLVSALILNSCSRGRLEKAEQIIKGISARYVPDKREGICAISVRQGPGGGIVIAGETTSAAAAAAIIDSLFIAGIDARDSIVILPDTAAGKSYMGLVTLSVINMRREPDHGSELVSQAIMGTPVMILKEDDGWILIQTPDSYIAWTEGSSVVRLSPDLLREWNGKPRVIYTAMTGWIKAAPGSEAVIGDIVAGAIVADEGTEGNMAFIMLPDGRKGYVNRGDIIDFTSFYGRAVSNGDEILEEAVRYRGLPYLWGGTSSKAVDCSGFVRSVFFMNGLILSRDASLQALHGVHVDISNGYDSLRKGDLLFFGSAGKTGPRVTHVAISKGGSEFIHAASKVMENSFDSTRTDYSAYRKRTLLSARRIPVSDSADGIMPVKYHRWYN